MDYVAEELPEKISEQVREHLAACRLCQTELEMARKASGMLTLLGHQEESRGVIRIPAIEAKPSMPWHRCAQLQLMGALLLVMVICVVGGGILRSFKRMPSIVRVTQPTHSGNTSIASVLPHPPIQQSVVAHTSTSVRVPDPRVRRHYKPHATRNGSSQTHRPDKPAIARSKTQPVQTIVEISPNNTLPVEELPKGAVLMVSVHWPSKGEVADDSYSYQYTEYDPKSGASIECHGSRHGESVEILIHGKTD